MEELCNLARKAFATHYHYLLKSQNFHWNVTGPDFMEFHELFGKIYDEVEDATDEFAEHLRGLRCSAPAGFSELNELSEIYDSTDTPTKDEMIMCLYKDNGKIVKILLEAYKQAEQMNEHGFSSFLAERLSEHRKHGWMLYSSITL